MPDKSESSGSGQAEKPLTHPEADAQELRVVTWWGLAFVACTVVWVFVIFFYVAHVGAQLSGVAALLSAIAPLILPRVESLRLPKGALGAILAAEVVIISVWGGVRLYRDHRPLNALSNPPGINAVPVGGGAEMVFRFAAARDHLRITFHITDGFGGVTQCASETKLMLTSSTDGGARHDAVDGEPVRIDLRARARSSGLSVKVVNIRNDKYCKVNISVQHARAYDWSWLPG